ncbi:MAG: T9SS type A sorting domain-containing protein [Chitinophagales bacterium]
MMQKKYLEKHLSAYAASAACFLLIQQEADAQVVYMDIDPDSILDTKYDFAELDLDNNGTADFFFLNSSFTFYTWFWGTYRLRQDILVGPAISENALAGISFNWDDGYYTFTLYYPYALANGELINNDLQWQNKDQQVMALRTFIEEGDLINIANYAWDNPDVTETLDHYLGIRFIDEAGNNHYGWIRCDVKDEGRTLVIKDYAYELQPDHPIVAGSTEHYVSIAENAFNESLSAYSFNKSVYIYSKDFAHAEVLITDIQGKILITKMMNAENELIEMTAYPTGIYFATVKSANKMFSKKIILN